MPAYFTAKYFSYWVFPYLYPSLHLSLFPSLKENTKSVILAIVEPLLCHLDALKVIFAL